MPPDPPETIIMITTDLITEITINGGFTFDPTADKLITVGSVTGYAIAVPGTEHVIGTGSISREAFASAVADVVTEYAEAITVDGCVLGGWYSADRDVYMIELTKIWHHLDRETAIMIGQSSHQEAIFDLATGEEIPTGGTGDGPPADPTTVRTWMDDLAPAPAPVRTDDLAEWENDLLAPADDLAELSALLTGDPWRTVAPTTTDDLDEIDRLLDDGVDQWLAADHGPDLDEVTDDDLGTGDPDSPLARLHGRLPWDDAATTPADAWAAADAPATGWANYLRANPIIGNLLF